MFWHFKVWFFFFYSVSLQYWTTNDWGSHILLYVSFMILNPSWIRSLRSIKWIGCFGCLCAIIIAYFTCKEHLALGSVVWYAFISYQKRSWVKITQQNRTFPDISMDHLRKNYEPHPNAISLLFPFPFKTVYLRNLFNPIQFLKFLCSWQKTNMSFFETLFYWANSYEFMSKTILK